MHQDSKWPDIDFKKIKLIVSDIDGTLKDVLRPLDPRIGKVIRALGEAGVAFTVATGKNLKSTRDTAEALGIKLPLILANGCVVQELSGKIINKQLLPVGFVETLIAVCDKENIELAVHSGEDIYVQKITHNASILLDYGSPNLIEVGKWKDAGEILKNAYKCIALDRNNRQQLFLLEKIIKDQCGSIVEYCHTLVEMLEFMPKGVSKVNGIKAIIETLNIKMAEVVTMGDGNNDVEMLRQAGFSLAVANGTKEVRETAKWIIPTCEDHGPLNFLEYFLSKINQ